MENRFDFLNWLYPDLSMKILMCLDDPSDLARVSCVSRSWRHHVITHGLCKLLCLRMFPQLSKVDHVVEPTCTSKEPAEDTSGDFMDSQSLEREHRIYSFLARGCTTFTIRKLIFKPIHASSTDNYPEEGIHNTLQPGDRFASRASYWSSKGQSNPAVPEILIYELVGDPCMITEINIQPFEAYFQGGQPIYSAKAVRFRMGHAKFPGDHRMCSSSYDFVDDQYVWTYTSQEFAMAQENRLQNFKLPEPVLCIGGILQIELLGRVQRQEMDGLFYICVSHVQIVGRSLSPAFGVDIIEPSGKFALKVQGYDQPSEPEDSNAIPGRGGGMEQIINILRGHLVDAAEYGWGEEEDDSDDEFVL